MIVLMIAAASRELEEDFFLSLDRVVLPKSSPPTLGNEAREEAAARE